MEPDPNLVDHVIQKNIIRKLMLGGELRFTDIKPKNIESNLFMYHLGRLKSRGLVEKSGNNYRLTTGGSMYVDRANLDKLTFRVQPKIVTILALKSSGGNWLLLERTHEPHMNRLGFPSGKLHYGESLEDSAVRELDEKAGLKGIRLKLSGSVAMRFLDKTDQNAVNHTIGYIFSAELENEPTIEKTSKYWRAYWGKESDLLEGNTFKGHQDILNLLKSGKMFIKSLDYESDY